MAVDLNSHTWKETEAFIESELEKARDQLEMLTLSHDQTMLLRGRIKGLRNVQRFGRPDDGMSDR